MSRGVLAELTELKKIILENPNLRIAVLVEDDLCTGDYSWMYAPNVRCEIGEILDCDQEICEGKIYNDKIEFEEDIADSIMDKYAHLTDAEFNEKVREEMRNYAPYWETCILVYAGL